MIKLNIKDFFKIDTILVFAFLIIPMIEYLNYIFRGVLTTWILFGIWICYILLTSKNLKEYFQLLYKEKISLGLLIVFIWIVALNYFFVDSNKKSFQYLIVFINYLLILIINAYYSLQPNGRRYAIIYLSLLFLGIQAAISIPYIISSGGFVTRAYSAGLLSVPDHLEAMKNGVGNNGLYSSSIILLFSIVALLKNTYKGIIKKIIVLSSIIILLSCFISSFFTPFLLLIIGVFIRFISKFNMDPRRLLKLFLLSIACTVLLVFVYKQLVTDSFLLRYQVSKIERSLKGQELEDPTGRSSLNKVSYETFKQNPFLGIGIPPWQSYEKIGEHNTWIDYLANFGILGVLPLYLFLSIRIAKRFFVHDDFLVKPSSIIYLKISITLFLIANFISPLITVPNSYQFFLFLYSSTQTKVSI